MARETKNTDFERITLIFVYETAGPCFLFFLVVPLPTLSTCLLPVRTDSSESGDGTPAKSNTAYS